MVNDWRGAVVIPAGDLPAPTDEAVEVLRPGRLGWLGSTNAGTQRAGAQGRSWSVAVTDDTRLGAGSAFPRDALEARPAGVVAPAATTTTRLGAPTTREDR